MGDNEETNSGFDTEETEAQVQSPSHIEEALRQEETLSLLLSDQKIVSAKLALQIAEMGHQKNLEVIALAHGAATGSYVNLQSGTIHKKV